MHPCYLKVNKELRSPTNEENRILSHKKNEVLEEDKGQHNKNPNSKSEELKNNTVKLCRNTVVEYKTNGSEEWKNLKIMSTQLKLTGKYSHWLNIKAEIQSVSLGIMLILFTNPSARAGYDTRSIFKQSLTGLNSEFSFS